MFVLLFSLSASSHFLLRLRYTGLFQHKGLRFGNGHGFHYAFPGTEHSGTSVFMRVRLWDGCSVACMVVRVAYVYFSGMDGVFDLINLHCHVYVMEGVVMLISRGRRLVLICACHTILQVYAHKDEDFEGSDRLLLLESILHEYIETKKIERTKEKKYPQTTISILTLTQSLLK